MKLMQGIIYAMVTLVVFIIVASIFIYIYHGIGEEDQGHKTILVVPGDTVILSSGDTMIIKRLK